MLIAPEVNGSVPPQVVAVASVDANVEFIFELTGLPTRGESVLKGQGK